MDKPVLPFDENAYDNLPLSAFVYEPILDPDGTLIDFRIIYANKLFADDWRRLYHNDGYIGARLKESTLMDDYSLSMLETFLHEPPRAFLTYMPLVNLHLYFIPMKDVEPPYYGFFIADLTNYSERESKTHFLLNIQQMKNNAVLMRRHEDGRLEAVYVSDAFAGMMEASVKEAMERMDGMGFFQSVHPEDRPLVRSMIKRRISVDGTNDLTVQLITAERRIIWCNVHFAFIDDFSEHYIYCTYTEVTTLKAYEERLRSVYTSLGTSFYRENENTLGLIRVNLTQDRIEEVKGRDLYETDAVRYPYSEAIRLRSAHYLISAEREAFLETFRPQKLIDGYFAGHAAASQVLFSRRRDGRACFAEFSATIARHPMTGDIVAFITEQECNAGKVREVLMSRILAQQFDMVAYLSEGRYGVTIGDAARITKGSIFPVNQTGEFAHYLNSQVFPVLSGTEEYKEEIRRAFSRETIEKQLRENDMYMVNIAIDLEGETFYKRFDFYTVAPDVEFYILLKSDTTEDQREQIQRNEQLRAALEEARQANVAKTAFLSSMSHEIRTPMNAIIGLDNIALKEPELPPRTREQLEKIGGSARHLLGLINDILDMSRIESGRMVLKTEEFSFRDMLEQINTMINGQCQDKGLSFDCRVLGQVNEYYYGDNMKLKQVLINILGNAVKFTPAPGEVTFTVERTAQFEGQSTLRFTIKDSGIGMDQEYIPRIFEAFSQENATTTNQYGGSGLGMAITKNIVEMMNGTIQVESEKGVGSTFFVNVTLRDSDRSDQQGLTKLRPQDMSVLVIDDDPVACEHAKLVLNEVGIDADVCQSGREGLDMVALRHARMEAYNLILVDWKMPEMNGVEVTRRIREIIGGDSAIVILSAYNWSDVEEEARAAGVDSFLTKPLFASGLMYEFEQAIIRRNAENPEEAELADLTGRHILLAEDMLINAEIMMELLEMQDISVDHAENGQIAADMFAKSEDGYYDAILMDVRMPVLDGLGATKAIRGMDRQDAGTIPIIAMTANAFDEDVQRSLQAGMNAHLTKPVEPERLYKTLAEFIAHRQ